MEFRKDGESIIFYFTAKEVDVLRAIFRYRIRQSETEPELPPEDSVVNSIVSMEEGVPIEVRPSPQIDDSKKVDSLMRFGFIKVLMDFRDDTGTDISRLLHSGGKVRKRTLPYMEQRHMLGVQAEDMIDEIAGKAATYVADNEDIVIPDYY